MKQKTETLTVLFSNDFFPPSSFDHLITDPVVLENSHES